MNDWMRAFWPGNNPMKELNMLEDVKEGDELIYELSAFKAGPKVVRVTKRTPKRIFASGYQFYLTGFRVGGGGRLRLQQPGEIKRLLAEDAKRHRQVEKQIAERAAQRAAPGYMEAEFLTGLGGLTTEEFLQRHDVKTIIKAAKLLGYTK